MNTTQADNTVSAPRHDSLHEHLVRLQLPYVRQHYQGLAQQAATEQWPHLDYLGRLVEGEAYRREERSIRRRIKLARFPVLKTLEQFQWNWPKKISKRLANPP